MKKKFSMILSVALIAVMAICGTLAYLTSTDSDVNVMTLGNVEIDQIEQERDENDQLQDFTQDKAAYPAVGDVEWAEEGVDVNGTKYKVFSDNLKNVVDKIVTVKNTGKSDAYVRTIVAIEAPDYDPNDLIHINYNDDGVVISTPVNVEIDGVKYVVFAFTYNEKLALNEISAPSLMQVFLDSKTTNEDCAKFGDTWEVKVLSQAVQTEGFADAQTALDTAFGAVTVEKVKELFGALTENKVVVTAEDLANIDFKQDNVTYTFTGTYEEDVVIESANGLTQTFDGTGAVFKGEVKINAPGVAHAYSSLNAERKGTVTIKGIEAETLNVLAYNNESVNIEGNNVHAMSVIGGNFNLSIAGNTVDGAFGKYTDGENSNNEYGISLRITDYELSVKNNVISNIYSHAIAINGRQGEVASDWGNCGANNKITSFTGNNITVNSTQKNKRAALKIWCDQVYAPYATSGQKPNDNAEALMNTIVNDNTNVFTLGETHTKFNIFDYTQ